MKKDLTKEELDRAEAAYAEKIYRERHKIERGVRKMLAKLPDKSSSISIRLPNGEIQMAKNQAASMGLRYQTYIKMLLHQALNQKGRK